ncbi:MAG TPA: hypothetical protein VIK14_11865 [Ignavibacteria bacterium]
MVISVLNGCSNKDNITNPDKINLALNHFTTADTSVADDNLLLDTVKILLKDLKFGVSGSDDSISFYTGSFLLTLRFNSLVIALTSGLIPAGTYDEFKFEVHKLDTNEIISDPEFTDANGRYSIITKGSFNGNRFVFKSVSSARKNLQFQNPAAVSSSDVTYITLSIKPYIWFLKNGNYLDPRIPANANDINSNIQNALNHSFIAFKDNDRNGIPD